MNSAEALQKKLADVLTRHQPDYALRSVAKPFAVCTCGNKTDVDLPASLNERMQMSTQETEDRILAAHAKHQSFVVLSVVAGWLAEK